ncbi:MAG: choice-of-anchor D domain-containing protein [Myxococcales bacterium]|nr:choice-of-anchor D domain-containing protein [Myxococcales bacterium]
MPRTLMQLTRLATPASVLLVLACRNQAPTLVDHATPVLGVSSTTVEFGALGWGENTDRTVFISNDGGTSMDNGLTLGVSAITLLDTAPENYSITYRVGDIACASDPATDPAEDSAAAKEIDTGSGPDTGPADTDTDTDTDTDPDTGTGTDTGSDPDGDTLFTLDPGCRIPVSVKFSPTTAIGEVYGALEIETISQDLEESPTSEQYVAAYHNDQVRIRKLVYLHGTSEHAAGSLVVLPRTYDFGYVNPEDTDDHVTFIELDNVGDGDLEITGVALQSTCDAAYSIVTMPSIGTLPPGGSTMAEVRFAPTDDQAAYCQLVIESDDPGAAQVDVTLTGNAGAAPDNVPPTAFIRSPENGYKYDAIRDLEMEVNIFDVNQPATTLGCRVYSAVLQHANVADCQATDESGHFFISVDPGDLDAGSDSLQLIVTDGSGVSTTAAVSIVISSDYPVDDDDGDGFGPSDLENPDCDEGDRNTYPGAAELFDLADNDCDGIIDEGSDGYDDDGDGVTEGDGDCNDYNDASYPGAPERGDGVDNDCDSTVDEGTALYDDDGDGYAEVNGDCAGAASKAQDDDAEVHPGAAEVCGDGIDNDCNGLVDSGDACQSDDSSPEIAGGLDGISADQYSCESGDVITLSVLSHDADGQVSTYFWQDASGSATSNFDNTASSTVHWTCPSLDSSQSGGAAILVVASVSDPDTHSNQASTKISVYPKDFGLYDIYQVVIVPTDKGCASVSAAPSLSLLGLALALAGVRRRRV